MNFEDNNVKIMGFVQAEELIDKLCSSDIYIHTAYIENSPNSICEAQYLGLPIISTHVGGIESLLSNGEDGLLVPANDPWLMADSIIQLVQDNDRMSLYANNGYIRAHERHNPKRIEQELLNCYNSIIKK